jgi:hypothetical protein
MTTQPDLTQVLDRLLGPAEPEVSCETCFDELDRYVELELAGNDADNAIPGLRTHLAGCPACQEDHDSLRALVSGQGPRLNKQGRRGTVGALDEEAWDG